MQPLGPIVDLNILDARLRSVQRVCVALVLLMLLASTSCWLIVLRMRGALPPALRALPDAVPVGLSLVAAVFILLSSRVRSTLLRRALPRSPLIEPSLEGFLPAYRTATIASFTLLALAGLLGPLVALISSRAEYGMIVCGASTLAMFTRWPRAVEVDRMLRGRARP